MGRKKWRKEDMVRAIEAVRSHEMGYKKAADRFNVPRTTLFRLSTKSNITPAQAVETKLGRSPVLPRNLEDQLVDYLLLMEKKFYGLTRSDVKRMAYQLATLNKLPNTFSKNNETAGRKWLNLFLKRHKDRISVRKPTGTSIHRAKGFNKDNVTHFFDILEAAFENHEYPADRVFNVDETGLSIVQSKVQHVLALRGTKQVGALTSAERGSLVTAVLCMSAGGTFVPPFLIFPRKNTNVLLEKGAPPGSKIVCHPSGWIQTYIFTQWFLHFIEKVKPSQNDPVLLVLDGHHTHCRNLEMIKLARQNFVEIVCLPPHSTHHMQPLDKTLMGPLKAHYSEELRLFLRINQRAITHFDIAELFGKAYLKVQTGAIAVNGFKKTGIFPPYRHVFTDSDFLAAEQENIEEGDASRAPTGETITDNSVEFIGPENISPIPTFKRKTGPQRGRAPGKAAVITSSPYKDELETSIKSVSSKEAKTVKRKVLAESSDDLNKASSSGLNQKSVSKKIIQDFSSESDSISFKDNSSEDDDMEDIGSDKPQEDDATCFYCKGKFSEDKKGEKWIECVICKEWCHLDCSGCETDIFICEFCKEN